MLFFYFLCLCFTLQKCEAGASCSEELQPRSCASRSFSSFSDEDIMNCTTLNFGLKSEQLELNRSLTFSSVQKFTLEGQVDEYGQVTQIICSGNAGIHFQHVCSLNIAFVEFVNCGASLAHKPTSSRNYTIIWLYAMFIENSADVMILQANFTNSNGTGLVVRNTHHVNISRCTFHENSIEDPHTSLSNESFGGGGGLHIESSCSSDSWTEMHCNESTYIITTCTFTDNHARFKKLAVRRDLSSTDVTGLGNGGGMELWFRNVAHHNITITNSVFHGNEGRWGGGLQVVWSSQARNNMLIIEDSQFVSNMALENGGGGMDLGYIGKDVQGNVMNFTGLNMTRNSALLGGGAAIFTYKVYNLKDNFLHFADSQWFGNLAHYGAAVNVAPQRLDMQENDDHFLTFENCTFESNRAVVLNSSRSDYIMQRGKGIFMVTGGLISFAGKTRFVNNNSTCVYAVSAILHFKNSSEVLFFNNSARSGAGISLIGYSLIVVAEHVSLTFCNNTVRRKGAAIYYFSIDKNAYVSTRSCFIQKLNPDQKSDNVHFNFLGNQALQNPVYFNKEMKPDTIYGSSLASCSANSSKFPFEFLSVGIFHECNVCKSLVLNDSDSGGLERACDENYTKPQVATPEQDIGIKLDHLGRLMFIPGKKFDIPLTHHNHTLEALYDISIKNHNHSNITIPPLFTVISKHKVIFKARPGDSATITLTELGFRKYRISFTAEALDCPPLYRLNSTTYKCECYPTEDLLFVEFHKCENFHASIRLGYWIDYIFIENEKDETSQDKNNSLDRYALLNSYCPLGYCSYDHDNNYRPLSQTLNVNNLSSYVCNNRTGTLCGLCAENLTVYFHSEYFKCGTINKCHLGPLFYLLSEILPMTVLFLVIIIFDISFTSGSLNGFIFFAQMYDTISKIGESFIPHSLQFSKLSVFHRLVYKIFNIDFFDIDELSFCLFRTRSTLNILMMKYVAVGYAFLLVVGTIWLIRFCSKFRCLKVRKSKYSVIQGLAAFLVMVYSQSTYVSFSILNVIDIFKRSEYYKRVVYFQGNIRYFSPAHLPYAIPAMLCILTLVLFIPLVLIVYPLCNKVLAFLGLAENRLVNKLLLPIIKIKPLLDCFQGTFKDEYRFFAGLYFVYRVTILSSRFFTGVILIFTIIEIQLIAMIALHATVWPYQKRAHNIIDLLIFVNLAIINSLKLLNFFFAEIGGKSRSRIRVIHWFQLIFIYMPLIGLCVWVAHSLFCKLKSSLKKKPRRVSEDSDEVLADDRVNGSDCNYDEFLDEDHRSRLASETYHMMQRKKLVTYTTEI